MITKIEVRPYRQNTSTWEADLSHRGRGGRGPSGPRRPDRRTGVRHSSEKLAAS